MRRPIAVAVTLLLAVLVVTAPVAADHTTAVSIHTTTSDFDSATTLKNVSTSNDKLSFSPGGGTTATRPADAGSQAQDTKKYGLRVKPQTDLDGLNVTVSSNTNGATTAYIYEAQSGPLVSSASISNGVANISADLEAGTNYRVALDAGGSQWTSGTVSSMNYPYTSEDIEINGGYDGNSFTSFSAFAIRSVSAWKLSGNGTYISANHTGSPTTQGFTNLTLSNVSATVTWQGSNGSSWNDVATQTYSTSGNKTLDLSGETYRDWRVNVSFETTGDDPNADLYDEGIVLETSEPIVDRSSATPQSAITGSTIDLEVDVSDADFGKSISEGLTVDFYVDGSLEGTDTLSSNGTASTTLSNYPGGTHQWYVEVSDQHGHTNGTSQSPWSFTSPTKLNIYDGDNPQQLVTDQVNVTIYATSQSSNYRDTRTTTSGTVVFGSVPNSQLLVQLNATGYANRQIIIDNPYAKTTRNTVLLNNSNSDTFEQCFQLDSRGAGFAPDETWLTAQRYLNGTWESAASGYFGAANLVCFSLEDSEQYRLRVSDGDNTRDLGGYEADISFQNEVINLIVENVRYGLDRGDTYRWEASTTLNESTGKGDILFKIDSRDVDLEDLVVTVTNDETGNQLCQVQKTGSFQEFSTNCQLNESEAKEDWLVEWEATNGDGELVQESIVLSPNTGLINLGLTGKIGIVPVAGLMMVVAGLFGKVHAPMGAFITAGLAALLSFTGIASIQMSGLLFALGIGAMAVVAAGGR